jgi:twitching motility protein PilI
MAARISLRDYQRELAARLQSAASRRAASKLGLQVGAENWLVDLGEAAEVVPVPPVTPVPLARPWFRGVANIRGNLYGVVDLAAFLGGAPAAGGEQSRLLLISERFRMGCGLLVDRSLGLRNPEELRPIAADAPRAAWVRAEYGDAEGGRWKELHVAQLVQQPEFLAAGA